MTRVLFIVSVGASGAPTYGGTQRTRLIFRALLKKYIVDVMIVGSGVADMHKSSFEGANKIFEAIHLSPSEGLVFSPLLKLLPWRIADKIASAIMPRRREYSTDSRLEKSLQGFSFDNYDLIVGRHLRPSARVGALEEGVKAPVVIDIDDRDDLFFTSRLNRRRPNPLLDALNASHARQARRIMDEKLPRARALWVVNERDKRALQYENISILTNIPYNLPQEGGEASAPQGETILFVGMPRYLPNWDGVVRFLKVCWPEIRRERPKAVFRVVGLGWERLPARLKDMPGIELAGFVENISSEYEQAAVAIAPILSGAGSKIKIIEALAHGRPVVADRHSAEGFPAAMRGEGVVCVDSDAEMAAACVRLLGRPEEAARLGLAGRAHVLASFTRARFEEIVLSDCDRVLHEAAARRRAG